MIITKGFTIRPWNGLAYGYGKIGELTNIKRSDINRILGFVGNRTEISKHNRKASKRWEFTVVGSDNQQHLCFIWDSYATGQWYSVYMPHEIAKELFGDRYAAQSGTSNYRILNF